MKALILFSHGARDPRWAAPFERLRDTIRTRQPDLRVELAFLEFMTPALPEIAVAMAADGVTEITLVPVFLGQGGHVLRDLPLLLEEIHQQVHSFGKFFSWKQRIWINKKEVASYEVVQAPLKSEETI